MVDVEVAFATPEKQVIVKVTLPEGSTVAEAIDAAGIKQAFPEFEQTVCQVGIFAKPCQLNHLLAQGDRIEIYRPLFNDPKDARRLRAAK